MKKPLRQRKKDKTRKAILENADRIFRKKGFDAATLDEIAEASDVHKQTVLRYFNSKEEIAFAKRLRLFEVFAENLKNREGGVLEYWRKYINDASTAAMNSGELEEWFKFVDSDTRLFAFQLRLNERYQAELAAALSEEAGCDPATDTFSLSVAALLVGGNSNVARMTVRNGDSDQLVANTLSVVDLAASMQRPAAASTPAG